MQYVSTLGSVNLGSYNGIPVRLHISCLLVAIFVFFFSLQAGGDPVGNTGFILLIWLAAVLLHEVGHCFMVHRIGGNNEMLVLTPFGGLSFHSFPQQVGKDFWVALSGPLLSFFCFICAAGGLWLVDDAPLQGLWGQSNYDFFSSSALVVGLRLAVLVNLGLTLVNLLPCIPFDGGWMLHALLWPTLGDQRAWIVIRKTSLATASGILAIATFVGVHDHMLANLPLWLPLTVVAVYCICFSAVPLSLTSGNQPDDLSAQEHISASEQANEVQETVEKTDKTEQHGIFLDEPALFFPTNDENRNHHADSAVDEALQCVYDRGLASLTRAQRKVLQEAAIRYRQRTPK